MTSLRTHGQPLLEWLVAGDRADVVVVDDGGSWTRGELVSAVTRRGDELGALEGTRRGVGVPCGGVGVVELLAVIAAGGLPLVGVRAGNEPPPSWTPPGRLSLAVPTSGSTGTPRWVALSAGGIAHVAACVVDILGLRPGERLFCPLPLAHSYGLTQLWCCLRARATLVLPRRPLLGRDWAAAGDCAVIAAIAPWAEAMVAARVSPRAVTLAGQATPPAARRRLAAAMPSTEFHVFYGLTEATSRVLALPPGRFLDAELAVGVPLAGTEVAVRDGELWTRGPHVSPGYLDDLEATAAGREGDWRRTGDAFVSGHDDLAFLGRRDGMVKRLGEKVFPERVESVILGLSGVHDVRVVLDGDVLVAEVAGGDVDVARVRAEVRRVLGGASVPDRVLPVPAVPRTPSGKVRR